MRFFTNEEELIALGSEYLRWVGLSWLLSAVSQVYLTFMKNCNAVNLSTVISSVGDQALGGISALSEVWMGQEHNLGNSFISGILEAACAVTRILLS